VTATTFPPTNVPHKADEMASFVRSRTVAPHLEGDTVEKSGSQLRNATSRVERAEVLDKTATQLDAIAAAVASDARQPLLRGDWLGHALHPLLTDFPLGCWLSAGLLDIFGGRSSRRAAQRLVGAGVLFVPPTIASGLADYRQLDQPRVRRVAVVHAGGNALVGLLYFSSWLARRRGKHARGVLMSTLGGLGAWVTGYLGGHLSFARGAGIGERGVIDLTGPDALAAQLDSAYTLSSIDSELRYEVGSLNEDELEH